MKQTKRKKLATQSWADSDLTFYVTDTIPQLTPEQIAAARRRVAAHAIRNRLSKRTAAELLDALGIGRES